MKKILSSLLAAMMLLCLCACTADAPETEAPAEGQSQEEAMKEQDHGLYNSMNAIRNSFG